MADCGNYNSGSTFIVANILISGGSGFIGSNLIIHWLDKYKDNIVNVDNHSYASNHKYIEEYLRKNPDKKSRYHHSYCDINNRDAVSLVIDKFEPDHIIHLAAESHVCRSIESPEKFFQTNIMGTFNLIDEFRQFWGGDPTHRFLHVSTDEVFGELDFDNTKFSENSPVTPRSPYAASKAASDHLVQSYFHTYGVNTVITNCTNNFGPNQHKEKLIPKTIFHILTGKPVTLYGQGNQVRDWLWVMDHCSAIDLCLHKGLKGQRYMIGGENELNNVDIVETVHDSICRELKQDIKYSIIKTNDRPTDDLRYAADITKIKKLGWTPSKDRFESLIDLTVRWYMKFGLEGYLKSNNIPKESLKERIRHAKEC